MTAPPQPWRPGFRRSPMKHPIVGPGKNMIAFVEVVDAKASVYQNTDILDTAIEEDGVMREDGPEIVLNFTRKNNSVSLRLTRFTEAELLALKEVFDHAFDTALPIVKRRDEIAEESHRDGRDEFFRSYRPGPKVFKKKRQGGQHD